MLDPLGSQKPMSFGKLMLAVSVAAVLLFVIAQASKKDKNPDPTPTNSSLGRASEGYKIDRSWHSSVLGGSVKQVH